MRKYLRSHLFCPSTCKRTGRVADRAKVEREFKVVKQTNLKRAAALPALLVPDINWTSCKRSFDCQSDEARKGRWEVKGHAAVQKHRKNIYILLLFCTAKIIFQHVSSQHPGFQNGTFETFYHCYDQMGVRKVRKVISCRDRQELQRSAKDCPIARQILAFWERLESLFRMFGAFGSHLKG